MTAFLTGIILPILVFIVMKFALLKRMRKDSLKLHILVV
jgi:hypothetical protein